MIEDFSEEYISDELGEPAEWQASQEEIDAIERAYTALKRGNARWDWNYRTSREKF